MNTQYYSPENGWNRSSAMVQAFVGRLVATFLLGSFGLSTAVPNERDKLGPGFVVEVAAPESDVLQALQDVLHDQTIHGTYVYEREKNLTGAREASSPPAFFEWKGGGHVFYKEFNNALAPRHFRDSEDLGTIIVRYIVNSLNSGTTRLRIDAAFFEKARHAVHSSDGTVESSEYKAIEEKFKAIQMHRLEDAEAQRTREEEEIARQVLRRRDSEATRLASAQESVRELEHNVKDLRRQTAMRVKESSGQLLTAPFHSALALQTLRSHTEVLILIVTPYWYGVETQAGQRGWVHRQQLEPLP